VFKLRNVTPCEVGLHTCLSPPATRTFLITQRHTLVDVSNVAQILQRLFTSQSTTQARDVTHQQVRLLSRIVKPTTTERLRVAFEAQHNHTRVMRTSVSNLRVMKFSSCFAPATRAGVFTCTRNSDHAYTPHVTVFTLVQTISCNDCTPCPRR
jgi:hypothetical protein